MKAVKEPIEDVKPEGAVKLISSALSPQFSNPHVSEPQPCSGKASTDPMDEVKDDGAVNDCATVLDCQVFCPQATEGLSPPQIDAIRKASLC